MCEYRVHAGKDLTNARASSMFYVGRFLLHVSCTDIFPERAHKMGEQGLFGCGLAASHTLGGLHIQSPTLQIQASIASSFMRRMRHDY